MASISRTVSCSRDLSRIVNPSAAACARCSSLAPPLCKRMRVCARRLRISSAADGPSTRGIPQSSSTMSGAKVSTSSTASLPSAASPTTSEPGTSPSSRRDMRRKVSSSSASTTRISFDEVICRASLTTIQPIRTLIGLAPQLQAGLGAPGVPGDEASGGGSATTCRPNTALRRPLSARVVDRLYIHRASTAQASRRRERELVRRRRREDIR
jgi:hypothetical protein